MLNVLIGIVLGWIVTNIVAGARQARHLVLIGDTLYRQIAGFRVRPCSHQLFNQQKINGIELAGCRWCDGVFINHQDSQKVSYE